MPTREIYQQNIEYYKNYRENHKEQASDYYLNNKEHILAKMRDYREEHGGEKILRDIERRTIKRLTNGLGMCLKCGELDFIKLEEHHPFGKEIDLTITFCANCHRELHFYYGNNGGREKWF